MATLRSIIGAIRSVSHWGVTPSMPPTFAKRIILTNLLGLLFFFNMSTSAIAFFAFGKTGLGLFTAFFVLTEISWPFLNRAGYHDFARLGLLITSNVLGFVVSVLLPDTGYNHGFYVMAGLPVLLFDLRERGSILLGFLLPVVLYPVSEWAQHHLPLPPELALTGFAADVIRYSIGTIYVVLIFMMFWFLSRENKRAQEQLELQRARAFSSAKFAALGEMAGGIAHEINNPLTVITLNAKLLERDLLTAQPDREAVSQHLAQIRSTIQRVARVVDSMRMFSRDGERDPLRGEILREIVQETLGLCHERFQNHGVRVETRFPEEEALIRCRSVQVSQVILNLLNNAFDAVEVLSEKWVRVSVELDRAARQAVLAVEDSGTGIPPEIAQKIFQPFFTTKPAGRGTGLGLSLSRKLIEDHGGTLALDPSAAHTRFVIRLPLDIQ